MSYEVKSDALADINLEALLTSIPFLIPAPKQVPPLALSLLILSAIVVRSASLVIGPRVWRIAAVVLQREKNKNITRDHFRKSFK